VVTEDELYSGATLRSNEGGVSADVPVGEEPESRPVSRLVFPVAGYGLLLDAHSSMEFLENQTSYHIPNNQPLFRGLINRRGSLVPVFDIRALLDDEVRGRNTDKVLVLGTGEDAVGVALDATPYRVFVLEHQTVSPPVKLVQTFGEHVGDAFERGAECYTQVALSDFLYNLVHEAG
jgi:chemotaxis signal transduction protein